MRYIYSMPVERIVKYFADSGFTLRKATANKLIARSADVLENIYRAICQKVLQQDYVTADETYHKVLLTRVKPTDNGSKKGYLWAVSAPKLGLVFFVYEDGSRSEQVILDVFSDYKGTVQSDAYAPYRKLESDAYPDIMRIACLQHVKRNFIDCGKNDKDAQEVAGIINRFYQEDKKHKVGVNGWTVEKHLAYRQSYAPDILQDLLGSAELISSHRQRVADVGPHSDDNDEKPPDFGQDKTKFPQELHHVFDEVAHSRPASCCLWKLGSYVIGSIDSLASTE